jgi:hypothetical protein
LCGEVALGLLPTVLVEAGSEHAVLVNFSPACTLL